MMKRLYLLLLASALAACEAKMPPTYTGIESAYITFENNGRNNRTLEHTFFSATDDHATDTVWITVQTMGNITPERRAFRLRQVNAGADSAAVAGEHYMGFQSTEIVPYLFIEKDSVKAEVPVILLKTEEMNLQKFKLVIAVEANEHFTAIDLPSYADFTIRTTAMATEPNTWEDTWERYFGDWGSVKMKFISETTGYVTWEEPMSDSQYMDYMLAKCQKALYEYNLAHPGEPLAEADGTEVTFN